MPGVAAVKLSLPEVAFAPFQPPEAVQEEALAVDQSSVKELPTVTVPALAVREIVGGGALTVTEAVREVVPPAPVQLSVNVAEPAATAAMFWLPEVALLPLHPPDAVQEMALAADQFSVIVPPTVRVDGLAARVKPGAGGSPSPPPSPPPQPASSSANSAGARDHARRDAFIWI